MNLRLASTKPWVYFFLIVFGLVVFLAVILIFFAFLLPFALVIAIVGGLYSLFKWKKKPKEKDIVDVKFKVK
tara:strand:- start:2729 stop:2944 length:216 start_codon:yes stop_codon:yes gene_type:complete